MIRPVGVLALAFGLPAFGWASCNSTRPLGTPAPSSFAGHWRWSCCSNTAHGDLYLQQEGAAVTGTITVLSSDQSPTIAGSADSTILRFDRKAGGGTQNFTLQVDATGEAMKGSFIGPHDPTVGTEVVAQRLSHSIPPATSTPPGN